MNIVLSDINWLAVIVATIAYSAFSGIWHKQFALVRKGEMPWVLKDQKIGKNDKKAESLTQITEINEI